MSTISSPSTIIIHSWTPPTKWMHSTAISITAREGICYYYYRRTKWARYFGQHPWLWEWWHTDAILPPPEAALSGDSLGDPINQWDMDNMRFHYYWDLFPGTRSIYIVSSKITIIMWHALPFLMVMEWTQNQEWISWMCTSRRMRYQSAAVLPLNPVIVDRSLCWFYTEPKNILLLQAPLRTAHEQVEMWMVSCRGNMSGAREMLLR